MRSSARSMSAGATTSSSTIHLSSSRRAASRLRAMNSLRNALASSVSDCAAAAVGGEGVCQGVELGTQGRTRRTGGLGGGGSPRCFEESGHRYSRCIRPVAIDRWTADAGLGSDRFDGDGGEAAYLEQGTCGIEDGRTGARITRPATAGRRGGLTHRLLTLQDVM